MDTSLGNRIAIVQAMSALIEETTLDKMVVSAICERAGLSRATFYRLFPASTTCCNGSFPFTAKRGWTR